MTINMLNAELEVILTFLEWEDILTSPPFNFTVQHSGDYALIKYDMRKTDMSLPAVIEARGVIIDKNTMKPVCRPFKKFFNIGEEQAPRLKGGVYLVEEKVDGSFIKVWKHKGKLRVSTNGTINAFNTPLADYTDKTFGDLFKEAVGEKWRVLDRMTDEEVTHMFELTSPYNRVVIEHDKPEVHYLGSRMNGSGYEYKCLIMSTEFKHPKRKTIYEKDPTNPVPGIGETYDSIYEYIEKIRPELEKKDTEGIVVTDFLGNKVKVKTKNYLDRHYHMTQKKFSKTSLVMVVLENEMSEVVSVRPEMEGPLKIFEDAVGWVNDYVVKEAKEVIEGHNSRKDMFLHIENSKRCVAEKKLLRGAVNSLLKGEEVDLKPSKPTAKSILDVYEFKNGEIKYEID